MISYKEIRFLVLLLILGIIGFYNNCIGFYSWFFYKYLFRIWVGLGLVGNRVELIN